MLARTTVTVLLLLGILLGLASVHALATHSLHETAHSHTLISEPAGHAPSVTQAGHAAALQHGEQRSVVPVMPCTDCLMGPAGMMVALCAALLLTVAAAIPFRHPSTGTTGAVATAWPSRDPTPSAQFHVFRIPLTVLTVCRI
ncbi:hypothetical protein [Pseudoclavibacter sp. JSM 162008]|uniref:hypothetical protein n=1 Tax=Pseudoclavibacter sp. JSM 162008 TaxID=3229855 RepID=UPI0035248B57